MQQLPTNCAWSVGEEEGSGVECWSGVWKGVVPGMVGRGGVQIMNK